MSASSSFFPPVTQPKKQNYYALLGITNTATSDEIKKAFRIKARAVHPDLNNNHSAHEQTCALNEAYEILKDAEKRKNYDLSLQDTQQDISTMSLVDILRALSTNIPQVQTYSTTHFQKLFEVNSYFTLYINRIFASLDSGISSPVIIIKDLLTYYLNLKESFWTLRKLHLVNFPIANKLQACLEQTNDINACLTMLDAENPTATQDNNFFMLWSAFFSIYPLYLTKINNDSFKLSLQLHELDNIYYQTIFQNEVMKPYFLIGKKDLLLIQTANKTEAVIAKLIESLQKPITQNHDECAFEFEIKSLHTLIKDTSFTKNVPIQLVINILNRYNDESNIGIVENAYQLLLTVIDHATPELIQNQILPLLKTKMTAEYVKVAIYPVLAKLGSLVSRDILESTVLPLLAKDALNKNNYFKTPCFAGLAKIFHLLSAEKITEIMLPILLKAIKVKNSAVAPSVLDMITQLQSRASCPAYVESINMLEKAIEAKLTEGLNNIALVNKDPKEYQYEDLHLGWLLILANTEILQQKVLPFLLQHCHSPAKYLRSNILNTIDQLSKCTAEKIPDDFKECLLERLISQLEIKSNRNELLEAIGHLITYSKKSSTKKALLDQLTTLVDFEKRDYSSDDINAKNTLAKLFQVLDREFIDIDYLHKLILLTEKPLPDKQLIKICQYALQRIDDDTAINFFLPQLMQNLKYFSEIKPTFISLIIPRTSYTQRVQLCRSLLKSYDPNTVTLNHRSTILLSIYLKNKEEIAASKQEQLQQSYEAVKY
ncbi:MAG: J domain-containing protein [Gammaproteobacteria bacterium]|nr:J domain-containing protein [Gammaproteobacteria bacterium]